MKKFVVIGIFFFLNSGAVVSVAQQSLDSDALDAMRDSDPFMANYSEMCAVCHGPKFEGTATQGPALVGVEFKRGDTVAAIMKSIEEGNVKAGMPPFVDVFEKSVIKQLAIMITERRANNRFMDFKVDSPLVVPEGTITTEKHNYRLESVETKIDRLPFSIAPMPDGRILVTEKTRGMRLISADGKHSTMIEGGPLGHDDGSKVPTIGLIFGIGWLLDVALDPSYEENGWIYLQYGDRCNDCNTVSRKSGDPVSMNVLVRARIRNGTWVDEEIIWKADMEDYTSSTDMTAGGRIAFDDEGHVFFSVGFKGPKNYMGIQDLSKPYGKIHRVNKDGSIPEDNPYVNEPGAITSTWTFGHRSPQGLEYDPRTKQLWNTEMGPRGGDELNLLLPGRNYGWPLYSKGLDYDGTPVDYGKDLGIEFSLDDIEQSVVDWTPSPAISSFLIYDGDAFPEWKGDFIVGSLKGRELYRVELKGNKFVRSETLLSGVARIRDVELAPDGSIYVLLEHDSGGRIVRMVPAD
ncbi:MAG: PQQ-dependent sugar dehydrogenase [Candidatus Hydrogenedentota bacterium]